MASSTELKKLRVKYSNLSIQEKDSHVGRTLLLKIMNLHRSLAHKKHRQGLHKYGIAIKQTF